MERAGVTWLALSLLFRVAYTQVTGECLIGLVLYAGESNEFLSPNANLTCREADVFFSNGSLHQKIPVKNSQPPCTEYPLLHLSLPDDAPLGPGKIVWQCDEGGPAACQVMSVQAATPASATATEYYLSQECVTNYPRTSLAEHSSLRTATTSGVDAYSLSTPVTSGVDAYSLSTPVDTLQESQDASQVSDGAGATQTQTNTTPVSLSLSSDRAFLGPNATWVATTPPSGLGQPPLSSGSLPGQAFGTPPPSGLGQPPLSSGSLPGQAFGTPPPDEDAVPTQPLEIAPPQGTGTDAPLTDASACAGTTTSAYQDTAATSSSDALGQDGSSPLIVQCICQC